MNERGSVLESRQIEFPQMTRVSLNCGMVRIRDGWLFAYRRNWFGARIGVALLDDEFTPVRHTVLPLETWLPVGRDTSFEDPRLFSFQGQIYCCFAAINLPAPYPHTLMGLCGIGEDLAIRSCVVLTHDRYREKNWQFFEYEDSLLCVYSIRPHRILRVHPAMGHYTEISSHDWSTSWPFGELRGGTPPVRVADRYFSFFHSSTDKLDPKGRRQYFAGAYQFEARPPFRATAISDVLLYPPRRFNPSGIAAIFPCGAVLNDGHWVISHGLHDSQCWITTIPHEWVAGSCRPIESGIATRSIRLNRPLRRPPVATTR